jgi:2-oxoglutarate ferredoxin oxidoreductase subunit alpha
LITGQYEDTEEYRRYDVTETGVSPRALPSTKGAIVRANSDEHKKEGFTSEDPAVTTMMMDKRMRKLATIKKEIRERNVETTKFYGSEEAQATVISWGSTKGAVREAMKLLGDEGKAVNFLQVIYLQPFPKDRVTEVLSKAEKTIAVENNSTSQLASLIRDHTLRDVDHKILKYDGRPFNPIWLSERIKEVL